MKLNQAKKNAWKILNIGIVLGTLAFFWTLRTFEVPPDPNEIKVMALR